MTELTTQELTDMRVIADDFFPDVCAIRTPAITIGAMGGITTAWDNTYTDVACRLDPESGGSEAVVNLALEGKSTWILNIPFDQAIEIDYKVRHQSLEYDIVRINDTHSYSTIRRALLTRVNDGSFIGSAFSSGFSTGLS
jgi:hypothetical protein